MSERRELKWLAILVCAAVGFGVVLYLALLQSGGILSYGAWAGLTVLVYIVTGLVVGAWAGFKGGQHGGLAGLILGVCIVVTKLVITIFAGIISDQVASLIIASLVDLILAYMIVSLGGLLGARIIPAKTGIAPPSVGEDSQEDSEGQHDEDNNQVGLDDSEVQEISRLSDRFRDW